jgi:HD-GYP domain-containing protein (c-di-GMP phosphodiesterase class II)/putative methionine-R-sulfoxide reductase with GAF domain
LDADGRYLKIAPTGTSKLVKPPDELLGRTLHEVFPAAEADNLLHYVRLALQQTEPIQFEYSATINGNLLWFDGTASALGADRVLWIGRDVSERIQRRTERMQRRSELEAIAAVSTSLRSAQTRAELVPAILDQLLKLLNANGTALDIYDSISGEVIVEAGRGAWAAIGGQRIPAGQGMLGHVIATGQTYVSDDVTTDAQFYAPDLAEGIRAAACVPLIAHGQVIGGLWVGRLAPLTAGDVGLLTAVADMAANAIHRASLFEQTERRLRRLAALRAIDLAIGSSLDLHITLDVLLDKAISQLGADAASVLLLSPHSHSLDYAAGRGFRSRAVERSSLRLGEGFSGRAALERRTLALPDLAQAEPGSALPAELSGEGFQAYYGVPLMAKGLVHGVLEVFQRAPLHPDSDWVEFLETLAGQAAIAVDNTQLFEGLQRSNVDLSLAYESTIEGWSRALDLRDKETEGHTQRVAEMTLALARAVHIDEKELLDIRRGALLHDIGKMGIPDSILLKPGPLTADEWVIMRQHPTVAYQLLSPIAYLRPALDIPYCHHEKWDGSGYPRGLKAEQIPLSARLFAVVDVWDALRSDRPYRAGWPDDQVREHIRSQTGAHFDPMIVGVFLPLIADLSPQPY